MSFAQVTPAAGKVADPRRWWVLAVMSLSIFMVFVDGTVVNTALPAISRDLGATTAELQWVADGYILILAGLLLVGGSIGDRFGRRRWLAIGMAIFGAAAVGAALSTNVETLIVFRGLQGLGAALVMPATLSILTAVFPRGECATAMGAMGAATGPALGGYLVDEISWSAVFWLHLPIVGAALAGLAIVLESRNSRKLPLDVPGAFLATGGLVALVFAIIQGNEAGWLRAPEIVGAFSLAVVLLVSFVVVEARSAAPMLPLRFFRQRDFTGAVIVIGITFFALFGVFFFLTQFFQLVQGKSTLAAGLLITPAALGMMVSSILGGGAEPDGGPEAARGLLDAHDPRRDARLHAARNRQQRAVRGGGDLPLRHRLGRAGAHGHRHGGGPGGRRRHRLGGERRQPRARRRLRRGRDRQRRERRLPLERRERARGRRAAGGGGGDGRGHRRRADHGGGVAPGAGGDGDRGGEHGLHRRARRRDTGRRRADGRGDRGCGSARRSRSITRRCKRR